MPRPRTTALLVPCALLATGLATGLAAPPAGAATPPAPQPRAVSRPHHSGVAAPTTTPTSVIDVVVPLRQSASARASVRALAHSHRDVRQRRADLRALAPAAGESRTVRLWATARGFTVTTTTPWSVGLRGRAADLAAAFGTSLTTERVPGGAFVRPLAAPRLPTALAGAASTVIGLDTRPLWRGRTAYGGGDVQVLNSTPVRGKDAGAGTTVATVNLSGWHPSDLATYRAAAFGSDAPSPAVTTVLVGARQSPVATAAEDDSGSEVEVALDAEAVAGVAPAARQRMYVGDNTSADYVLLLQRMAADLTDADPGNDFQTASTSWGACESDVTAGDLTAMSDAISTITAAGATFFAASGDSGSSGCDYLGDQSPAVDFPASARDAVAVGGTRVTGDASGYSSSAWSGSGGGCSARVAAPGWQRGVTPCTGRAVPDIATIADPASGVWAYDTIDQWVPVGGTSLAAPAAAAGLATVLSDAHLTALPPHPGAFADLLYSHPGALDDVTSGSNGAYRSAAGYDLVTGLGSPRWTALEAALLNRPEAAPAGHNEPLLVTDPAQSSPVPLTVGVRSSSGTEPSVVPDGELAAGYAVSAGSLADCSTTSPTMPTSLALPSPQDGTHAVTVAVQTSGSGCLLATRSVTVDSVRPVVQPPVATFVGTTSPAYRFSWPAATDPSPGTGVAVYGVLVKDATTGVAAASSVTAGQSFPYPSRAPFTAVPGHRYVVELDALDGAFNLGSSTTTFVAPYDDAQASLSRHRARGRYVGDWARVRSAADYRGSHVASNRRGAAWAFSFTGRSLTVGVDKGRYGGYADVYVDGVRRGRISLWARSTAYRQPVRLASFPSRGAHRVLVRVVGAHQAGALGCYVYLDSLTVA